MKEPKKIKEELVYDGYRKIVKRTFEKQDGTGVLEFDVALYSDGVAILAFTEDNKIICFKQFRPGPEKILYELPGGAIDTGETPSDAIKRELLEETGYSANLEYIGSYYRDSYISGKWHMFIGHKAEQKFTQKLDEQESGEVTLLSIEEFKEKLFEGMLTDTTLGYAGLNKLGIL